MKSVKFIGMDVHKNSIAIAVADEGRDKEVRGYGTISNTFDALDKAQMSIFDLVTNRAAYLICW